MQGMTFLLLNGDFPPPAGVIYIGAVDGKDNWLLLGLSVLNICEDQRAYPIVLFRLDTQA